MYYIYKINAWKFVAFSEKPYLCTALNEGTEEFPLFFANLTPYDVNVIMVAPKRKL